MGFIISHFSCGFVGDILVVCCFSPHFVACQPRFAGAILLLGVQTKLWRGFNCASGIDAKVTSLDVLLHGLMLGTATSEVGVELEASPFLGQTTMNSAIHENIICRISQLAPSLNYQRVPYI